MIKWPYDNIMNSKEPQIIAFPCNFDVLCAQWSLNLEDLKGRLKFFRDFNAMLISSFFNSS